MGEQGPLPYLEVGGVEVANAARTIEYLRNGLGDTMQGHWILGPGSLCGVLYRENGGSCGTPEVFVSPAADPAPWYDATEPGSASFLGVVLLDLSGYDSTVVRPFQARVGGLGGASFADMRRGPRTWKFRAALISGDDAGAEYGLRWLTNILEASACDTCATTDIAVRLTCPPSDCSDDTQGKWTSYEIALVDGPHLVEQWSPRGQDFQDTMAGCRDFIIAEWTMVAGNPFLYKPEEECLPAEIVGDDVACTDICDFLFGDPGEPHCCTITPPERGTLGAIFTLQSISGMNNVLLGAYEDCPSGTFEGDPVYLMEISGVPAGGTVVVDGGRQTITVTTQDPDTGELVTTNGETLIVPGESGVQWVVARDCDTVTCFCARTAHPCSQGGDTLVSISTQLREG